MQRRRSLGGALACIPYQTLSPRFDVRPVGGASGGLGGSAPATPPRPAPPAPPPRHPARTGRTLFILFCATLCFAFAEWLGYLIGSLTAVNGLFNGYVICVHPSFRSGELSATGDPYGGYTGGEGEMLAYLKKNPALAQKVGGAAVTFAKDNPDVCVVTGARGFCHLTRRAPPPPPPRSPPTSPRSQCDECCHGGIPARSGSRAGGGRQPVGLFEEVRGGRQPDLKRRGDPSQPRYLNGARGGGGGGGGDAAAPPAPVLPASAALRRRQSSSSTSRAVASLDWR